MNVMGDVRTSPLGPERLLMWHNKMTCISDDCEIDYWGKKGQLALSL